MDVADCRLFLLYWNACLEQQGSALWPVAHVQTSVCINKVLLEHSCTRVYFPKQPKPSESALQQ